MTQRIRLNNEAITKLSNAPFTPTAEQRQMVRAMSSLYATEAEICQMILNPNTDEPITPDTLRKYFSAERMEGREEANQKVSRALFQRAVGKPPVFGPDGKLAVKGQDPDITAAIWWEKSRLGYKEGQTIEHTGPNGVPLEAAQPNVIVMIPHNGRDPLPPHRVVIEGDVLPGDTARVVNPPQDVE